MKILIISINNVGRIAERIPVPRMRMLLSGHLFISPLYRTGLFAILEPRDLEICEF